MDRPLTTTELAKELGISPRTVRHHAARGRIPSVQTPGGHRRFDRAAVVAAIGTTSHRESGAPTLKELRRRRREIVRRAARHGARDIRIFGSVATDSADPGSDIDLLVTLDPDRTYFDVETLEGELERLLGYGVDVLTDGACHGPFASVADDAVPL